MKFLKKILSDNKADMNMERVIIMVIAFAGGALLVAAIVMALTNHFPSGMDGNIHQYLD